MAGVVDVFVVFTGIVSFVPIPPAGKEHHAAVVQNAYVKDSPDSHLAYIVLPKGSKGTERLRAAKFKHDDRKPSSYYDTWLLEGWDLSFDNRITSPTLDTQPGFRNHLWPLREGCHPTRRDCDEILDAFLDEQDPKLVSARMNLRQGELDAWLSKHEKYQWRFANRSAPYHFLAQRIRHHFTVDFDDSDKNRYLNLQFSGVGEPFKVQIPTDGGVVAILIGNTLEDLDYDEPNKFDHHVKLYYGTSVYPMPDPYRTYLERRKAPELLYPAGDALLTPAGDALFTQETRAKRAIDILIEILRVGGANCPPGGWSG